MSTIQSAIDRAATFNKLLFVGYVILLLLTAAATVFLWMSGNRVQDEIRKDADARIATADSRAEEARRGAAEARAESDKANAGLAKSNEEIARLTAEAEKARAERAEADKQIAIAKADAARAKEGIANAEVRSLEASAEVSRLQVIVANAEQRRAEAELALAEVRRKQAPRQLPTERFLEALRASLRTQRPRTNFMQQRIIILYQREDIEAFAFATQIASALYVAGWKDIPAPEPLPSGAGGPQGWPTIMKLGGYTGLTIVPPNRMHGAPEEGSELLVRALLNAFTTCGVEAKLGGMQYLLGEFKIMVGPKP